MGWEGCPSYMENVHFLMTAPVQVLKTALQGAGKLQDAPNPILTNYWGLLGDLDGESIQVIT